MFPYFDRRNHDADDHDALPPYIELGQIEDAKETDRLNASSPPDDPVPLHDEKLRSSPRWAKEGTKWATSFALALVPSFLRRTTAARDRLHPTAWLDGLRGIAALFVVFHHSSLLWFSMGIHSGWAAGQPLWLIQLPIIRLLISGPPQVAIFFVVSGYAISCKPLRLARQGRFADVGSTLSSSFFRRHPRLFMPAAAVTLATALMTQLDWFSHDALPGVAVPVREPPHANNLWDQLMHFTAAEIQNTDPIGQEPARFGLARRVTNPYDANLWTLAIEFNSSMVVFSFLAAFARIKTRVRMAFGLALVLYLEYYFVYWALFLFFGGMLACEVRLEVDEIRAWSAHGNAGSADRVLPLWAQVRQGAVSRLWGKLTNSPVPGRIVGCSFFILALWLLSTPDLEYGGRSAWTYETYTSMLSDFYYQACTSHLGAIMMVLVVDQTTWLQGLFTNPFSQYLGRISYSLYLVHGPLLWTLGSKLGLWFVALIGGETYPKYGLCIALAALLWWLVAIWVADLVHCLIDSKSVAFTRAVYIKLSKDDDS